jgi:hypothetical protein
MEKSVSEAERYVQDFHSVFVSIFWRQSKVDRAEAQDVKVLK